jgi:DNA-binding CsgD family transcriptional regulator
VREPRAVYHDIARELGMSEPTVKTHLRRIFHKLGASSRVDAINRAGLMK